jgi:hypothetical protein
VATASAQVTGIFDQNFFEAMGTPVEAVPEARLAAAEQVLP